MAELTMTQAAAALGRSYNQVHRLVLLGVLQGQQRDGRWVVKLESVEDFLRRNPRYAVVNGCRDGGR